MPANDQDETALELMLRRHGLAELLNMLGNAVAEQARVSTNYTAARKLRQAARRLFEMVEWARKGE